MGFLSQRFGRAVVLAAVGVTGVALAMAAGEGSVSVTDARSIFCADFVPNEKASWASGAVLNKWARANPGEVSRWTAFAEGICAEQSPSEPAMTTLHGKTLLAAGRMALPEPPPPPTTTTTTEPPPTTTGPPPSTAQLWVDTNGGTCTRNSAPAGYVDATACSSFSAAHSAASAGDLVLVKGGVYGSQTISANKGAPAVVFREAIGETVNVDNNAGAWDLNADLTIGGGAGFVTFENMHIEDVYATGCASDKTAATFRDMDLEYINLQRTVDFSFVGGDIGPTYANATQFDAHPLINDCGLGRTSNQGLLFDGVYFHDAGWDGQQHTECLLVTGVDGNGSLGSGMTIRKSRFFNCDATGALYITRWNFGSCDAGEVKDVLLENNFFYDDTGYTSGPPGTSGSQPWHIQLETDVGNFVYRNNTSAKSILVTNDSTGCGYPSYGLSFKSNYGSISNGNCVGGGNLWTDTPYANSSTRCATTDGNHDQYAVGGLQVVDDGNDLHLVAGANAIDRGASTSTASTDIDGQSRPLGAAVDAGADEKE